MANLCRSVNEFDTYIHNNRAFIPNFGERDRQGDTITPAFVESTINQVVSKRFVKKQQMQWTPQRAHLLLQTRTRYSMVTSMPRSVVGIRGSDRQQHDPRVCDALPFSRENRARQK